MMSREMKPFRPKKNTIQSISHLRSIKATWRLLQKDGRERVLWAYLSGFFYSVQEHYHHSGHVDYPLSLQFNIKLYNFIQADAPRDLKERGR